MKEEGVGGRVSERRIDAYIYIERKENNQRDLHSTVKGQGRAVVFSHGVIL